MGNSTSLVYDSYYGAGYVQGDINSPVSFYPQRDYASEVAVQIDNLTTSSTPDQYLNSLMRGDAADYKDLPEIRFTHNTTNNIVLSGHPGFLLNGTFRDPTSDALQEFTNVGTIIGDKAYSAIYHSPAETNPVYSTIYSQMIKSFEVVPQKKGSAENAVATSTYENTTYGIRVQYPSDWSVQESNSSGELITLTVELVICSRRSQVRY